jgi:hypothetical protein
MVKPDLNKKAISAMGRIDAIMYKKILTKSMKVRLVRLSCRRDYTRNSDDTFPLR